MNRTECRRVFPGDPNFTSESVMFLLDIHCGVGLRNRAHAEHSMEWFPGQQYRVITNRNYLVDPSITNEILVPWDPIDRPTLAQACYLASPWLVSEASWGAFSWDNRVVYVPHFRQGEKNNVYRRATVEFNQMPKPSWNDFKRWEEDVGVIGVTEIAPRDSVDRRLLESQGVLVAAGHPLALLETARAILSQRISATKAPIFQERGGLGDDATDEEVRTAKVTALNDTYLALEPAALDAAMLAEVERIR